MNGQLPIFLRSPSSLLLLLLVVQPTGAQDLAKYFQQKVAEIARLTEEDLERITPANWESTRAAWREELREMLGLPSDLKKTPLAVKRHGTIQLDGVQIERLHYQSRPGLYVAATLYRPDQMDVPESGWPAVLYVCGHARATDYGRLLGNKTAYQHHGLWLARHGFVCLMIDTIQLGELHGEHHGTYKLGRWDWISRGYTPGGVEAWNAIRGVDLLCELPEVDPERIGVTGRSGGGAYSWYAAALDERIRVAVPVAGITDLQNHVIDGCVEGHCDCMYFVNYYGWDYGKLAAMVAPRALLLENSDNDRIFPLDGVVRIDRQLRSLYERLGAAEQYGVVITPGPHKDTQDLRVPAFRFFMRHLQGISDPVVDSPAAKELAPAELLVFQRETPREERVTSAAKWFPDLAAPVSGDDLEAEWERRWLPHLTRIGILPKSLRKHTGVTWSREAELQLFQVQPGGQLFVYHPAAQFESDRQERSNTAAEKRRYVLHLVLESETWQSTDSANRQELIAKRIAFDPKATHFFYRWSNAGWRSQVNSIKAENQLVRRFYLLGETPEQRALHELLHVMKGLADDGLGSLDLVGTDRESTLLALAALYANYSEGLPEVKRVTLETFPRDPLLSASCVGLLQVLTLEDLYSALRASVDLRSGPIPPSSTKLLVENSDEPQLANGIRIVEATQDSVKIWVRATRFDLPNLGDLPEVQFREKSGKRGSGAILPEQGVAGLRFAVPGLAALVRVGLRGGKDKDFRFSRWQRVDSTTDFSALVPVADLEPDTDYAVRAQVQSLERDSQKSLSGQFRTLPRADQSTNFKLAVSTCQSFEDRDGPHGFDMYRTILARGTNAFVMAGDVVYYDRLARSPELAYYHWQRTYSLPTLVEFHRRVPSYFLKDDHDTYVNDSWPGERRAWTDDFTFEMGQTIFRQETGLPAPAYRTLNFGRDLQVWLMEGRDYRSPNPMEDGPRKTIWGTEQMAWLERTLKDSKAIFKVIISPTPWSDPIAPTKKTITRTKAFRAEGSAVRKLLASIPNTISVCGDRHWQFHSVDPETGLHEFSVGPASDRHAGGWKPEDFRPAIHRYLRVAGGYLEIEITSAAEPQLILRHLDTQGKEHHRHVLSSARPANP